MRFFTFQNKNILKILNKRGMYKSLYLDEENTLINNFKNDVYAPIFGLKIIRNSALDLSSETIKNAHQLLSFNPKDTLLFDLEVPEGFYQLDELCYLVGDVSSMCISSSTAIYATFPFIKSEWVRDIYMLDFSLNNNSTEDEFIFKGVKKVRSIHPSEKRKRLKNSIKSKISKICY